MTDADMLPESEFYCLTACQTVRCFFSGAPRISVPTTGYQSTLSSRTLREEID